MKTNQIKLIHNQIDNLANLSKYAGLDISSDSIYNFNTIYSILSELSNKVFVVDGYIDENENKTLLKAFIEAIDVIEKILNIYHKKSSRKIVLKCPSNDIYDSLYLTCYVFLYYILKLHFDCYSFEEFGHIFNNLDFDYYDIKDKFANCTIEGNQNLINYYQKVFDEIIDNCNQRLSFIKPYHDRVKRLLDKHFRKPTFEIPIHRIYPFSVYIDH